MLELPHAWCLNVAVALAQNARLIGLWRAQCAVAPLFNVGGGAAGRGSSQLAQFPLSTGGPRRNARAPAPPGRTLPGRSPRLGAERCGKPNARSRRRHARGTALRGDAAQYARRGVTARSGCQSPAGGGHGKASGVPVSSRGVTLTAARPPKLQVALAGRGQAGRRGAPEAASQPTGPPPGRAAIRSHQPQPPRRSHGEAERVHLVAAHTSHRPRAGRLPSCSRVPGAPRSHGSFRRLRSQLRPFLFSWGPPPIQGGKPRHFSAGQGPG
ncbi:hypothetical protein NDU88_006672 [Pleurodeles waltl]|uniref:Uncharacterized protein n=1 Tax=Pleurodeles waltl TaxID=8319 RepID=A0AAV7PRC4_PLEWA|nr:hypothetical protein NDU88_006672 [Pleurodeles waltl]